MNRSNARLFRIPARSGCSAFPALTVVVALLLLPPLPARSAVAVPAPTPDGGGAKGAAVTYLSGKDTVTGWLSLPSGDGPHPAVIVIHEWWGLTPWVKENAEKLAAEGYAALAIDLYRGAVAGSADEAHQLMRGVPEDRAARDLMAAFSWLRSRKDVDGARIGSVGWCMGGGYSLQAAVSIPELAAAVICYGRLVTDSAAIAGIGASVFGVFGEKDKGIPAASVREFEAAAKAAGRQVSTVIYPEAGHAFMNPGNAGGYREADAKDAWARILGFFAARFGMKR